ncbi:GH92 family glycosyl hydrolase [Maribellus sp. YY47]|uniref:GH92 family glycosyl hydrolase n=1 Tax=Maribellus sp. YY47 TaxID=2929486 RepID=UPI002000C264|nr:GH92 family glycosyl hydrolase [Maribellus sp. YY47]MCK3686291.1 GH92 family glycosyl hydrolase [Maribellus sp. YY47]
MVKRPNQINILLMLIALGICIPAFCNAQAPAEWVNPFIGSTNYGTTNPGAIVPRGMVSVVPFNVAGNSPLNKHEKDAGWWSTPYSWDNKYFTGFSHVNLSGVGCPELGVILLMPTTGDINADFREYGSEMSQQAAHPGYYSTFLNKYNILAEASATERTGISRFTFPSGKSNILIDLGNGLTNESGATLRIVNDREVEGSRMTGTFCYNDGTERPVYFVARFSKTAEEFGVWKKMPKMNAEASWSATSNKFKYYKNYQTEIAGDSIGAWFSFNTKADEQILVEVGVSYVSIDNARQNLNAESNKFDFEATRKHAEDKWNKALSTITVKGGTDDQKTVFYTALYHMQIHPNILSDVNGQYPAMESFEIKERKNGERYTVFSLWDTYRNLHPFFSLAFPEQQLNMVNSLIEMYDESGWLPRWELNSTETHVMEGDPVIPVIVDTWFRGIRDFDIEKAYEGMRKSATTPGKDNKIRPDIDEYLSLGYVPLKTPFDNSVSHALEYYMADWNLAQLANNLGKTDDYERFLKQSRSWKNYYDDEFGIIRPKLENGKFLPDFDPKQGENFEPSPGFHEGNAYQYNFCAQHDMSGMIELNEGKKNFVKKLQATFDEGNFDMTNEPDIHYPWLFNYVKGEEWRTQKEVRRLIATYFKNAPDGLPGNDDTGTMSAWVVYAMMGMYPVIPGDMNYTVSSPVFDEITIKLDQNFYPGQEITIRHTGDQSSKIKNIKWNGKSQKSFFINHAELVKGGILEIIH